MQSEKLDYNEIERLWNTGEFTMEDIGKKMNRSRERIRQVMIKMRKQGYNLISSDEWYNKKHADIEFIRKCSVESFKFEMPKYDVYRSKIYHKKLTKLGLMTSCMKCGYKEYPILEVHHVDKNRKNNRIENLLVVCPNCHKLIHMNDERGTVGVNHKHNRYHKEHLKKKTV